MAQISFDQINLGGSNSEYQNSVGFFTLKNDRDEAVVRFLYDDVSQFDILTVHDITVNGKFRKVSCLSDPYEPVDKCPMCAAGTASKQRFFIKMLQYVKQPDGSVRVEAKIWERSVQYAVKLKGYLDNYGPLSDMICKVVRHGAAGNMQTDYEIIPNLSKQIYPDNVFVKDVSAFDNYKILGGLVMDKTADEMRAFLATGSFPQRQQQNNGTVEQNATRQEVEDNVMFNNMMQQSAPNQQMPWEQPATPQQPVTPPQQMPWQNGGAFNAGPTSPARQVMPWEQPQSAARPVRNA